LVPRCNTSVALDWHTSYLDFVGTTLRPVVLILCCAFTALVLGSDLAQPSNSTEPSLVRVPTAATTLIPGPTTIPLESAPNTTTVGEKVSKDEISSSTNGHELPFKSEGLFADPGLSGQPWLVETQGLLTFRGNPASSFPRTWNQTNRTVVGRRRWLQRQGQLSRCQNGFRGDARLQDWRHHKRLHHNRP